MKLNFNVLITGSEGFIGKHLTKYLHDKGMNVFGIDRVNCQEVLDITEEYLIRNNIRFIVHLAAQTSVWNDDLMLIENDNIKSFIHIFLLAKKLNLKFIYASSSCSINVTSMYGLSKQFDDAFAEMYGWDRCIGLRFHNVYGPNSRPNTLMGICENNSEITLWNNGKNVRHFTWIYDVCEAIVYSFVYLDRGLYNIVNPEEYTTKEFCEEVAKHKHLKINYSSIIRELDKEEQHIDTTHKNIISANYMKTADGIAYILNNTNE